MKQVKVIFLMAITFCVSQSAIANSGMSPIEKEITISEQIRNFLVDSDVARTFANGVEFDVKFKVNFDSEIIAVTTSKKEYEDIMKSILYGKKISVTRGMVNKTFIIPIRIDKR